MRSQHAWCINQPCSSTTRARTPPFAGCEGTTSFPERRHQNPRESEPSAFSTLAELDATSEASRAAPLEPRARIAPRSRNPDTRAGVCPTEATRLSFEEGQKKARSRRSLFKFGENRECNDSPDASELTSALSASVASAPQRHRTHARASTVETARSAPRGHERSRAGLSDNPSDVRVVQPFRSDEARHLRSRDRSAFRRTPPWTSNASRCLSASSRR